MMTHMVALLSCLVWLLTGSNAFSLLESAEEPLIFTRRAPTEAHAVVVHSEVRSLLDWHVVCRDDVLRFRVALLLQPVNSTLPEDGEPSLVGVGDIATQCARAPLLAEDGGEFPAVALSASRAAVHALYVCRNGASGILHMLVAQWLGGDLSAVVDEPVMSFGVAKSWLLPHDVGGAAMQLLYVLSLDGATSAILLERVGPLGAHPLSITQLRLPQRVAVGETELVASCFLPSVGVSGLVRRSPAEGVSYFELYRLFPTGGSAELLLDTSTAIFTDLSTEERRYCSLSSRVDFTHCRLTLSSTDSLNVGIAVTATLESPTAGAASREFGGWVRCGETRLEGSAIIMEGGTRVHVSPLRRAHFKRVLSRETVSDDREVSQGRLGRCSFHHSLSTLNCSNSETRTYAAVRGVSHHCTAVRVWWRPSVGLDRCLCDWLGVGLVEVLTFALVLFVTMCGVQLVAELLLRLWGSFFG
ncbi:hypothetical protein DQ04_01151080 [Trypanosoma grayi]|uniref:hypothetical protein n=1 Tax=Trypanosoma grayi TaxID=71804 RepID=UPI0004F470BE|nr:hypothetical protein DQ04_01151080 [Trypanosoma grayi]KEG13201.1 hypothetical protein DQ04_01151080 [Trypanosoma grayi]